jgi:hypothetical protein
VVSSDPAIAGAVENLTTALIARLANGEAPTAAAVRLLLRRYAATGRDDILRTLEPALTQSLDLWPQGPRDEYAGWLMLFAETAAVSDDDRVIAAATGLSAMLREAWGRDARIAIAAAAVEACLRADAAGLPGGNVQGAIDELERIVSASYEPGEGLSRAAPGASRLGDLVSTASALLTAFDVTARLPYSMLAEELMQFAAGNLRDADAPEFVDAGSTSRHFILNCEAASVLCRLAALHGSEAYLETAVVAAAADYGGDAGRILRSLAPKAPGLGLAGAAYGLAAADWHSVL